MLCFLLYLATVSTPERLYYPEEEELFLSEKIAAFEETVIEEVVEDGEILFLEEDEDYSLYKPYK